MSDRERGSSTSYLSCLRSIFYGIVLGYLVLILIEIPLARPRWNEVIIFGWAVYAITVLALSLASFFIGDAIARVIIHIGLRPYDKYLNSTLDVLRKYRSQSEWPGRKFLDLLRPARSVEARREFLLLGLEAGLPDLSQPNAILIDRLSSILLVLELEAIADERNELAEIARKVHAYLHQLNNRSRIRRVILSTVYVAAPAIIAWLLAANFLTVPDRATSIFPNIGGHVGTFFSNKDQNLDSLMDLIIGLIFLVIIPFVIYAVGQTAFVITWGLGKRTATALDDVVLMVLSWSLAGVVGIALLTESLQHLKYSPEPVTKAFVVLRFLMLPPEKPFIEYTTETTGEVTIDGKRTPAKITEKTKRKPPELPAAVKADKPCELNRNKESGDYEVKEFIECKVGESGGTLLRIGCIAWFTAMLIVLLRALCGRVLRQMAARTEQRYDDMAVELTSIFGTVIIIAIGLGWILLAVLGGDSDSGRSSSDSVGNSLLPVAILVAVAGAVMAIASRDLLTNFFAGVSLRIDKPFDVHERIVLDNGAVCEVRSIGMRSTHFFNIIENTDIYVPNSELATKTIVNLSRPDREYRRVLTYWISDSDSMNLQLADRLLLLGAYSVEGIDSPTIRDEVSEGAAFYRNRLGIVAEFIKLQARYDECASAIIKFHGKLRPVGDVVEELCADMIDHISRLNSDRNYRWAGNLGETNNQFIKDLEAEYILLKGGSDGLKVGPLLKRAHDLAYNFYELAMCFYTLGASYPAVRSDLEPLILEILRAPSVRSSHAISQDGSSAWKVELVVYAQLTEQSDEILHHLNLFNQRVLQAADLLAQIHQHDGNASGTNQ
mgnify:CR=1 FL=1